LIKNELYIVEINSGIMFEKYANFSKNNYIKATQIYKKAIIESFKHE
jgi:hypothetical protein